jgi:hypothetical protein
VTSSRITIALIISPWSAPALIVIAATIYAGAWPFHYELGWITACSVVMAYVGLLLWGLPLFRWLQRLQRLDLLTLIGCGAIGGVIFIFAFGAVLSILFESPLFSRNPRDLWLSVLWGLVLGSTVAATFGLIAGVPTGRTRLHH